MNIDTHSLSLLAEQSASILSQYIPRLFLAGATLWGGFKLVRVVTRIIEKALGRKDMQIDTALAGFLQSLVGMSLKVLVLLTVASMVGVEVTSFVALIGAAGLAIGVSLQGALSNFAGGVMLLLFRPFGAHDYIRTEGHEGFVEEITMVSTVLRTLRNETVIIPNGPLANGTIINYTKLGKRRLDLVFGISYDDDIRAAKKVIEDLVKKAPNILNTPAPFVGVKTLGESSVDLACCVWVKPEDYIPTQFILNQAIKEAFDAHKISIPYPHRVVYNKDA